MKKVLFALFFTLAFSGTASAQLVSAQCGRVIGAGNGDNLKVSGIVSIVPGQTLHEIKIERGTVANGVFTPLNPAIEEIIMNPAVAMNQATYSHTFPQALPGQTTYWARVSVNVTRVDPITGNAVNVTVSPAVNFIAFP